MPTVHHTEPGTKRCPRNKNQERNQVYFRALRLRSEPDPVIRSGIVIVCDGTEAADKRIARVLWNDPGTGVMRHADAGYEIAKDCAKEQGLKLPMP